MKEKLYSIIKAKIDEYAAQNYEKSGHCCEGMGDIVKQLIEMMKLLQLEGEE